MTCTCKRHRKFPWIGFKGEEYEEGCVGRGKPFLQFPIGCFTWTERSSGCPKWTRTVVGVPRKSVLVEYGDAFSVTEEMPLSASRPRHIPGLRYFHPFCRLSRV